MLTRQGFLLVASLLIALSATAQDRGPYAVPETDEGLPGEGPIRRADWFLRLWEQRRSMWAESVEQDQGSIVFLGDSITQGWNKLLEESFQNLKVANRGISGDTTRGVLIRLHEDVIVLNPRAIVLLIGTNDIEENASPETIASNLSLILSKVKKHNPEMPILLCEVFPSHSSMKRPSRVIKELNALYRELAAQNPQITVLDTFELFADKKGNAKLEEFPDLLHPNEAGYQKWAEILNAAFDDLGLQ